MKFQHQVASLVAWWITATVVVAQDVNSTSSSTCDITCLHGSVCKRGAATFANQPLNDDGNPFSFLNQTSKDGHWCECVGNYTALHCGTRFERCRATGSGHRHVCYYGGKCLTGLENTADDTQQFCDCTVAGKNGIPMVGKYCEVEAAEEIDQGETDTFDGGADGDALTTANDVPVIFCDETRKTAGFCFNGGTCKTEWETEDRPCECLDGHRGVHCEFVIGSVPECDLACENGGTCRLGVKSYEAKLYNEFWDNHENYMTCDCPTGYYGNKCEISGVECGDKDCFNGATCEEALSISGATRYFCNCQTASDETDSFAGQHCESESTTFCRKSFNNNGILFCTHGGTCNDDESSLRCNCPKGYHGPACELTDSQTAPSCTLTCQNGGECRNGAKDTSMFTGFGPELSAYNKTHNGYWEHCVCPEGFFGIQCEHQLEICAGGDHVCLHGSKCVATGESKEETTAHECDCDSGFDAIEKHAGKFCQYSSTDICTVNGRPGVGKANFAFCVNNGKCKQKVADTQPHPGCNCPTEFEGDHCEYLEGNSPSSAALGAPDSTGKDKGNKGSVILGLAITTIVLLIIVTLIVMRCSLSGKEEEFNVDSLPVDSTPVDSSGPPPFEIEDDMTGDGTDNDLKTVEIL